MRHRISRHMELCPDCGHHIVKNNWCCSSCGWSIYDSKLDNSMDETNFDNWFSRDLEIDVDSSFHWFRQK